MPKLRYTAAHYKLSKLRPLKMKVSVDVVETTALVFFQISYPNNPE